MAEGKVWQTIFHAYYGLFKLLVMPLGLPNTPATFQNYINHILVPYLDHFYTSYLNDICYTPPLRHILRMGILTK
jgi:hypothetical protein